MTPGEIGGQATQLVDARLLHQFLEVAKDFSTWIKGRIAEFEFAEGEDYLLAKRVSKSTLIPPFWGIKP